MTSTHRVAAIVSGLWLLFGPALAAAAEKAAAVDAARLTAADKEPGNWMSHGRTYGEQRFSPLARVNDRNVDRVGLAWQFKYDLDRVVEATPIVVDGVLYTTGAYSMVYALDATSGKLLWKYDPEVNRAIQGSGCCDAANRGVAVWKGRVYVGVYDRRLVALDARTGRKVWSVDTVIDHERNYTISGAPHASSRARSSSATAAPNSASAAMSRRTTRRPEGRPGASLPCRGIRPRATRATPSP